MKVKFATDQQLSATAPQKSFWVSANAGTGKTKVLVNRIIALIASGVKPSKILCITFTKTGAAEMISRINSESIRLLLLKDEDLITNIQGNCAIPINQNNLEEIKTTLQSVVENPDLIRIQTIHSFCGSILKSFPLEANIAPFFNTADEIQTSEILELSWNNFIKNLHTDDKYFNSYSNLSNLFGFDNIKKTIFSLFEKKIKIENIINNYNGLNNYLSHLQKSFEINLEENPENIFFEKNKENLEKLIYYLKQGKILAQKRAEKLSAIIKKLSIYKLNEIFFDADGSEKEITDKDIKNKYPEAEEIILNLRNSIKLSLDNILTHKLFSNTKDYLNLFEGFKINYEIEKNKNYFLDYDDLIEKTKNLLNNSEFSNWILYKLDGGIEHILVDESQDTSPSQWQIIKSVSEEFFNGEKKNRSIFIVGDEKQSIFSFQGADLKIFTDIKSFFDIKIKQSSEQQNKILNKIPLSFSFRTLPAILELTDEILKNKNLNDLINHIPNRINPYGYIEINDLIKLNKKPRNSEVISWFLADEYEIKDETKQKSILAENISQKINSIINTPHFLPKTSAQAKAGDIMILLRKRDKELISLITEKLQKFNIQTSGLDKINISENLAILDILSCAKFLLNKKDDYNLACLLKSAFINLTEEEIFNLLFNRKTNLYNNLLKNKDKYNSATCFLEKLENIKFNSVSDFFFKLLDTCELRKILNSYFGKNINEVLNEFLILVDKYEANHISDLQLFIKWFEKNSGEIKRNSDLSINEIRIMTIHSAKGLESPIVILADTTSVSDEEKSFVIDDNYILIPATKEAHNAFTKGKILEQKNKDYEESLRLLYVAITRACDELYIYGAENNNKNSWHSIIKKSALNLPNAKQYEDKILVTNDNYLKYISEIPPQEFKKNKKSKAPEFYKNEYQEINKENIILPSLLSNKSFNSDDIKISKHIDFERGTLIHKLLEIIPDFEINKQEKAFDIIINNFGIKDNEIISEIKNEVFSVLLEFNYLFKLPARKEVSISGYVDNNLVNGKIDRLIFENDKIHLIDYKTHKNPENQEQKIFNDYKSQMFLYYQLLKNIYPNKKILPKLLLTSSKKILSYNFDE